ncbi:MAG: DUF2809 domain-containing protein [Hamadaea sp.]|uniref:ribosomal maturation YjgA family protein n=1 Tax=Hamadaea sp. TaxID=2024425 RepID=UPI0017C6AB7E|nr:DUF2809 domain-containing protein [Hamadaea sp.]NUT21165.1 DUF2809 domain-containing protein [Hamadaea sp.]
MTRTRAAVAGVVVLLLGLGVRAFTAGAFAKYAGVALYAVLVYFLVLVVAPRVRPLTAAVVALGFCWAVEFFQLTPIPAELSDRSTVARLVLGSTFNAPDLLWYAVGIGLAALLHRSVVRRGGGGLRGVPRQGGAARS